MWNKGEDNLGSSPQNDDSSRPISPMQQLKERAIIGHTVVIKGDLSGDEDMVIHGSVEGTIRLENHNVTVGQDGRVQASVDARVISVEGNVQGNLNGLEKVIVRKSGTVVGNITAPGVILEDGCKFTGKIDMESKSQQRRSSSPPSESKAPTSKQPSMAKVAAGQSSA